MVHSMAVKKKLSTVHKHKSLLCALVEASDNDCLFCRRNLCIFCNCLRKIQHFWMVTELALLRF